jgi:indolepyruvate ferredoxin oxidoreductase, beta subunit
MTKVTNVVFAGLGGQGVLKASDILAEAVFHAGLDVKKSEIHGMSQRGGSVTSDVRFGDEVLSPMVPQGEADFLVVLEPTQVEPNRHVLAPKGVLVEPGAIDEAKLPNRKCLNVAILGVLCRCMGASAVALEHWHAAIREAFDPKFFDANLQAFEYGRSIVGQA